jgi:hypothetical protein
MSIVSFVTGFVGGWAARSAVDSPEELGVKLVGIATQAKARFEHWAAVERERIVDLMAEARARQAENSPRDTPPPPEEFAREARP